MNPKPKQQKDIDAWNARYALIYQQNLDEVSAWSDEVLVPGTPHRFDHQQLARVAQMVMYGPGSRRNPTEYQALLETQVEFYDGPMTIRQAVQQYDLGNLQHLLEYRDGTEDLAGRLDGVKDAVRQSADSASHRWRLDNGG